MGHVVWNIVRDRCPFSCFVTTPGAHGKHHLQDLNFFLVVVFMIEQLPVNELFRETFRKIAGLLVELRLQKDNLIEAILGDLWWWWFAGRCQLQEESQLGLLWLYWAENALYAQLVTISLIFQWALSPFRWSPSWSRWWCGDCLATFFSSHRLWEAVGPWTGHNDKLW